MCGSAENLPPFSQTLDKYYGYRGWDESGVPSKKLHELGLTQVIGQVSVLESGTRSTNIANLLTDSREVLLLVVQQSDW